MEEVKERIVPVEIDKEMRSSYIDYAMSVIVGRALPDSRDGLKPVHRRILYSMLELGLGSAKPFKKSARIVGEVMGKYHPHGDTAIYETLCRMAQTFSLRYPLIKGQGNFGSIDGDPPAAMRYTEAKLSPLAMELLADLEKDVVDFTSNFDESLKEPTVLSSRLPNLLLNGSSGIAVGMATNIPPHNLTETCKAIILLIDKPDVNLEEIMTVLPGPDFPTGGYICGRKGIKDAYQTGRGLITLQGKIEEEETKKGKESLIISEIPYGVNKSSLVESIANLAEERKIDGIQGIRDESDKEGMRVVIELKSGEEPELIKNQLYKHTQLRTTYGVINLALVNRRPRILSLRESLLQFLNHRKEVIVRRSKFDLRKAEERAHILEGIKIALSHIDKVIKIIRESKIVEEAKLNLMKSFSLSEKQAESILAMPLSRLTGLEREKVEEESKELSKKIKELKEILESEKRVLGLIKQELKDLIKKYGDNRRTQIIEEPMEISEIDLIRKEEVVVTITQSGYIKRMSLDTFRRQHRGGKGIIGIKPKEEDYLKHLVIASTLDHFLFFTNQGKVYKLFVYQVPAGTRQARGKAIVNLLPLSSGEVITAIIPIKNFEEGYLTMVTRKGLVKKTSLSAFSHIYRSGIIAIRLREGDELIEVKQSNGEEEIIIGTKKGKAIRFSEKEIRPSGRATLGVKGIILEEDNEVVGAELVEEGKYLLTVTSDGYRKRTRTSFYRSQHRAGRGVIDIKTNEKREVVGLKKVSGDDEIALITRAGIIIRERAKEIRAVSRNTIGVHLINLGKGDSLVDLVVISKETEGV